MRAPEQTVPTSLPLLDAFIEDRLGSAYRLDATAAVLIQHQVGSIVPMTQALLSIGLNPDRLYWVDIPYSANEAVASRLVDLGIPRENFAPSDYRIDQPFARYQFRRVSHLVGELHRRLDAGDRLLVLDDGAYFLEAASSFARAFPRLAVVEQTRRGIFKLRANAAASAYAQRASMVNVAEARPKITIEPVFIAEAISRALLTELESRWGFITQGPLLILGYGAIGSAVALALVNHLGIARSDVHVFDPRKSALANAQRAGFAVWDRSTEDPRYHLVVGCSGTTSFTVGDRVFLEDGAVLASGSSGSAELSREEFVELADAHDKDDVYIHDRETLLVRSIHSTIHFRLVDRDAYFLNGGFPINFDGRVDNVPASQIQLTRALMVAGAVQALEPSAVGMQPLDRETCDWLSRRYEALMGHAGVRGRG